MHDYTVATGEDNGDSRAAGEEQTVNVTIHATKTAVVPTVFFPPHRFRTPNQFRNARVANNRALFFFVPVPYNSASLKKLT
jgi:hypothetical protein